MHGGTAWDCCSALLPPAQPATASDSRSQRQFPTFAAHAHSRMLMHSCTQAVHPHGDTTCMAVCGGLLLLAALLPPLPRTLGFMATAGVMVVH